MKITVGVVDNHQLFLKSLSLMLSNFKNFEVIIEALNGKDLQEKISIKNTVPDIMLIDVNMPVMDGEATARWLKNSYPAVKLVALSVDDDDTTVVNMIKAGCCCYLLKDAHPDELEKALREIFSTGKYSYGTIDFMRILQNQTNAADKIELNDKELKFLDLACSEMTYKEIANSMGMSEHTIDGYRASMFTKLKVQSRVGLALECVRRGIHKL